MPAHLRKHYFQRRTGCKHTHTHAHLQGSLIFLIPAQKMKLNKLGLCKLALEASWRDSPWWALICGSTLCKISKDFLWYSAWISISYRRYERPDKLLTPALLAFACLVMFQADTISYIIILYPYKNEHLPSERCLHSLFLWPQSCTCLLTTGPKQAKKNKNNS